LYPPTSASPARPTKPPSSTKQHGTSAWPAPSTPRTTNGTATRSRNAPPCSTSRTPSATKATGGGSSTQTPSSPPHQQTSSTSSRQTDLHVAEATLTELRDLNDPQAGHFNWARAGSYPFRMLFRAQRIHCQTNHYTYVTEDGLTLWESDSGKQEPALPVDGLHCEHRANQRALDRIQDKNTYYTRRDKLGIERGACIWPDCNDQATETVAHNFRRSTNAAGYVADLAEACAKHAKRIDHENRWTLRQWGIDLDTADVQLRDGAAA
jgi:hypothetical protein